MWLDAFLSWIKGSGPTQYTLVKPNGSERNSMTREFDLREAINAVSDVVMNRPKPLREFDQIYMKVADMVIQAHYIAERFKDKNVVFIGDGDAIGLSVMHLSTQEIFSVSPKTITLLDFDERIVNSVTRFAENYGFKGRMTAYLYNVADALPEEHCGAYDAFYTNPPWGKSNGGESVFVFLERGIEATNERSEGAIVIADDPSLPWTQEVLAASQHYAFNNGFNVAELIPQLHHYHLDDAPELQSCTCLFRRFDFDRPKIKSLPISEERLHNFYGRDNPLIYKYIRETVDLNYGKASDTTYKLEPME